MWVGVEGGDKLRGCVREGRWLGLDEKSKGICVYWLDTKTVSIEQNIHINKTSASCLEGEDIEGFIKTNPDLPDTNVTPKDPSSSPNYMLAKTDIPHAPEPIQSHPGDKPPDEPKNCPKCFQKPTQCIKDILNGIGVSSDLSKSQGKLPLGVQFPTQPPADKNIPEDEPGTVLEGEGISDWMMVGEEHALAAKTSKTKALEPQNLTEAKSQPDWPSWEKAI